MRAQQVREIKTLSMNTPYPVIVCGDFNDTPVSYSYQQLRGDFNDAFVGSGKGIWKNYIGKLPSFRIDNIFYSNILNHIILRHTISGCPIICRFRAI